MEELLKRARKIMPGGVSSPVRALKAVNGNPVFTQKAKGAKIWDVNGKEYIDMCMSFGPLILGHANDEVITAIKTAAEKGTSFGTSSENEVILAEKIIEKHPVAEWVRFVNSGTEAVISAIRLARGYTNRDMILKFAGCYHGHGDSMLVKAGSGLQTFGISSSAGVPHDISKNTIVIDLGSIETVKQAFELYSDKIAAVIVEGIPANNGLLIQSKEFMTQLRQICHNNGSLLILDEVITGFRIGWGGASTYYNIKPDIITFGKVIGGGLPVGAYAGRKELMEYISPLGPVYQAGTLSGNPLAMAAGIKTLEIIERDDVYSELENQSSIAENRFKEVFATNNVPLSLRRVGSIFWLILEDGKTPINPDDITEIAVNNFSKFHKSALKTGIYLPPSAYEVAFLSTAHPNVMDELIDKMDRVMKQW